MTKEKLACIILAAGQGKRMKSVRPKAMHELAGRPMIGWLLETVRALDPRKVIVVTGPGMDDLEDYARERGAICVVQKKAMGTADAVRAALPPLRNFSGDVLILLGDMPLVSAGTLRDLIAAKNKDGKKSGLAVLGAAYDPPPAFGRLVRNINGTLQKIVEDRDCTPAQRRITLCNTGAFCVDGARLPGWLAKIKNKNAQKEFYITDVVEIAAKSGASSRVHVTGKMEEVRGVNGRGDLAALERIVQERLRTAAMEQGATLIDPDTVYFSWDTKLGRDVTVEPNVVFGPGVTIADNVTVKAFSHLEGATVAAGASIGPHARLRPGSVIGEGAKIGNFVEVKNSTLGAGVKAAHLAYIGDAQIGDDVNFSCGAITVNYDGVKKHKTVVGAGAMVGSNVNLVAPITIGDGAYIAAGSTITKDVPAEALAVAREKPFIKDGWAAGKRKKKAG